MNTKVASAAKALNNGGTHSVQYNVCEVAEPTTPIVDVFSVSSISFPLFIFKMDACHNTRSCQDSRCRIISVDFKLSLKVQAPYHDKTPLCGCLFNIFFKLKRYLTFYKICCSAI